MKIIKFIIPSLLLFMPIGVFAGVCDEYTDKDACEAAADDSGCFWSPDAVLESIGVCNQCGDGYYSIGTKCEQCPAGSYCVDGVRNPCPAGTYSSETGLKAEGECTQCGVGEYSDEGQTECKPCTEPHVYFGEWKPEFFTGAGDSATSCPWSFYCEGDGKYPKCDENENGYTCSCPSCDRSYEVLEKKIKFDGKEITKSDSTSGYACLGEFKPLELVSDPDSLPDELSNVGTFKFYAITKEGKVLISATPDPNPENYKKTISISNVVLGEGLNCDVSLSIGDCKFETSGCGSSSDNGCQITVPDECIADIFNEAVDNYDQETLKTEWGLDVPVLIAEDKLEFNDNNELYIEYTKDDNDCFQWVKNIGEVVTPSNPLPVGDCSVNEGKITENLNGYNEGDGRVTFLGYTIGCGQIDGNNLSRIRIMLEDFEDPDDCGKLSVLTKEPGEFISRFASLIVGKNWSGIDFNQEELYSKVANGLKFSDSDKRCFIVGLYGYPPCTPGCYCPEGKSMACADSPSPFTSNRGSKKHSDCYLKSGVKFKEGAGGQDEVTQRVEDLLSPGGFPPESIKLVE